MRISISQRSISTEKCLARNPQLTSGPALNPGSGMTLSGQKSACPTISSCPSGASSGLPCRRVQSLRLSLPQDASWLFPSHQSLMADSFSSWRRRGWESSPWWRWFSRPSTGTAGTAAVPMGQAPVAAEDAEQAIPAQTAAMTQVEPMADLMEEVAAEAEDAVEGAVVEEETDLSCISRPNIARRKNHIIKPYLVPPYGRVDVNVQRKVP